MKKYPHTSKQKDKKEWWKKIDYLDIIRRTLTIIWLQKRKLIFISIIILLTGGQLINSSTKFSLYSTFPQSPATYESDFDEKDWEKTLNEIEGKEILKEKFQSLILGGMLAFVGFVVLFFFLLWLISFLLNSYFHISFMEEISPCKNEKKLWLRLVLLRLLIGFLSLLTGAVLLFPTGFFMWQRSWLPIIFLLPSAIILWIVINIILSYVRRYSFFYLTQTDVSISGALDGGYNLFMKKWKESILTSLVNFAVNMIAGMAMALVLTLLIFILILLGLIVSLLLVLLIGKEYVVAIIVVTLLLLVLTPVIIAGIFLKALWEAFILVFWFLFFREIAGSKKAKNVKKFKVVKEKGREVLKLERKKTK